MCLLVLAWQVHPRYPLILAANRDEFHARAAAPFAEWPDDEIFAGRDLAAGGTWLGVDRQRRFGVVTNFREGPAAPAAAPSRGRLIPIYLRSRAPPQRFLASLERAASEYAGFNVLLGDAQELWYASNRATDFACRLPPGIYGLSNRLLDTPWPKLMRVRRRFEAWVSSTAAVNARELLTMLDDRTPSAADDDAYPADLAPEWRRALSAPFVQHPLYGTRCSTVVLLAASGTMHVTERRFDAAGDCSGETAVELS
ncbi:MAG TPA: NRDE family protein [Steroidobacteraceae bacterium]|nr:NRDE family protein [Steroidobacteraceae bacterium]